MLWVSTFGATGRNGVPVVKPPVRGSAVQPIGARSGGLADSQCVATRCTDSALPRAASTIW